MQHALQYARFKGMNLVAFSKAGYSSWFFFEGLRLLLDAGEGLNTHLEGHAFKIQEILLSHSHTDHVAGLHALLSGREVEVFARDRTLPRLRIIFPGDSPILNDTFEFLRHTTLRFDELVELCPLIDGESITSSVRDDILFTAIATPHMSLESSLAFRISQKRKHLRRGLEGLDQEALRDLALEHGPASLNEPYITPLIYYSGDSAPFVDEGSHGVELLIHEATFLAPDGSDKHSTLERALEVFRALEAKKLILFHLSTRYTRNAIEAALTSARRPGEDIEVVFPGEHVEHYVPIPGL